MSSNNWHEDVWQKRQEGMKNLQSLCIETDGYVGEPLKDYSCTGQDGQTSVYFRDLEQHLITHIKQCDVVLGCVAWLTSEPILTALTQSKGVSIIVQKEDFLRPDMAMRSNWSRYLRRLYDKLPSHLSRFDITGTSFQHMSCAGSTELNPIRCVGNYNADKLPAFPRSHHKFVVFCSIETQTRHMGVDYDDVIVPKAVWTGSFNFTKTAGVSFENAVVLRDPTIVNAFYQEYAQVASLSEPLDWETEWAAPEWRIGT